MNARSRSWSAWSAAAIRRPAPAWTSARSSSARLSARSPAVSASRLKSLYWLLNELAALLHGGIARAPGHDRHRRGGVFRRAVDQPVRIDHVDQHVALGIATAHDLHLLEEQRAALAEHVVALAHFILEADRPDLPASQRDIRDFLGKAKPALEAALLRYGEMTGHAVDLGVVDAIGRKLVVGAQPFEDRRPAKDQVRFVRRGRKTGRRQGQGQRQDQKHHRKSPSRRLSEVTQAHTSRRHKALRGWVSGM